METINANKAIHILHQKGISLFTVKDAKKIFRRQKENTLYKLLQRLENKNVIKRVKTGKYLFTFKEISDFELANFLIVPSYVSLESALSFYGILSQFPYTISSVTSQKNKNIIYQDKEYEYDHIGTRYFFGFIKKDNFLIASPEKALLDELYFMSKGLRKLDLKELELNKVNKNILKSMAKKYKFLPLKKLLSRLI